MHSWHEVETEEDIKRLLEIYGGFHDACLVSLNYKSGAYVDAEQTMHFGLPEERELHVFFHRQWEPREVELCFTGLRKYCIAGWQNNYFCDMFDCYLAIHQDLIAGRDESLIVWADGANFSPKDFVERDILAEPVTSYVIAENLRWRLL